MLFKFPCPLVNQLLDLRLLQSRSVCCSDSDAVAGGHKPGDRIHHFTELGTEFLKACRPPEQIE